jgi:hypothetical protein
MAARQAAAITKDCRLERTAKRRKRDTPAQQPALNKYDRVYSKGHDLGKDQVAQIIKTFMEAPHLYGQWTALGKAAMGAFPCVDTTIKKHVNRFLIDGRVGGLKRGLCCDNPYMTKLDLIGRLKLRYIVYNCPKGTIQEHTTTLSVVHGINLHPSR